MIIYRPHRGHLNEAMVEAKEFDTELEMKQFIVDDWNNIFPNVLAIDDIVIDSESIVDESIGWMDTRYVCTKSLGTDNYMKLYGLPQCIGMCATDYKKNL